MDGYLLYRQYLDNVCDAVTVYKIPRYSEKNILEVLSLSKKIEDLGYLDEIFASAGESISYLGNKDFMNKTVIIVSKLETMIDLSCLDESMQNTVKEMFREGVDEEEDAIEELQEFLEGLNSISDEDIKSGAVLKNYDVIDTAVLIEKEKESLSELFKTMNAITETVKEVKEEEERLKEPEAHKKQSVIGYDSDEEVDLFNDGFEEVEDLEENDEIEEQDSFEDIEEVENEEDIEDIAESDDVEEVEDLEEQEENQDTFDGAFDGNFEDDLLDEDLEGKDFSKFISNDSDEEENEEELDFNSHFGDKEDSGLPPYFPGDFEDDLDGGDVGFDNEEEMSMDLNAELSDFTMPESDSFDDASLDEATDYFMTKSSKAKQKANEIEELKRAYKSKERLKNSPDLEPIDDNLAKILLAMGVAFMSLPSASAKLMAKLKGGTKKLKETMVVEDDEDE